MMAGQPWLIVDLDNTLVRIDLLKENLVRLALRRPWRALRLLLGAHRGRVWLKSQMAELVSLQPGDLPYRESVLDYIQKNRNHGRKVALVSASHQQWVHAISDHLQLFDAHQGTSGQENLKGEKKLPAIRAICGDQGFEYVGDSWADLPVWQHSSAAVAVNPSSALLKRVNTVNARVQVLRDEPSKWRSWIRLLRPHQWVKNVLLFTAPVAAHTIFQPQTLAQTLLALVSFSALASAVYVFNDLADLSSDRKHPSKRFRPIALGLISAPQAVLVGLTLVTFSAWTNAQLERPVTLLLGLYVMANVLYSGGLKKALGLDLIFLSLMYTLRIFVGAQASGTPISHWLLSFSTFLFFGLACLKRTTELSRSVSSRRAYLESDTLVLTILGTVSSFCALVVLILYFGSNEVRALYRHPDHLWAIVPIALYGISRLWLLQSRAQVDDDPVVYALKDWRLHLAIVFAAAVIGSAV